ncbi:hypothetical protein [Tardiphaga sp. 709]|jgi:hypothetical protein|uniref:hypothetical protein n=1 Tax=unclassified Tardiphaga TaxID=2631404 RepID=UPI0028EB507C|nr:hypothetical protein [Tardiphaga sp. 709]WNV11168.1 hypothetical protein RSO67_08375 [Tardiphaga sp. 709]
MKTDFPAPSPAPVGASMIVSALHESRRRQAINIVHRYQHLISDRVETNLGKPIPSPDTRVRQIQNSERKRNVRRLSETHLIILILIGFGIVHVIGGVLLARAAPEHSRPVNIAAWGD